MLRYTGTRNKIRRSLQPIAKRLALWSRCEELSKYLLERNRTLVQTKKSNLVENLGTNLEKNRPLAIQTYIVMMPDPNSTSLFILLYADFSSSLSTKLEIYVYLVYVILRTLFSSIFFFLTRLFSAELTMCTVLSENLPGVVLQH